MPCGARSTAGRSGPSPAGVPSRPDVPRSVGTPRPPSRRQETGAESGRTGTADAARSPGTIRFRDPRPRQSRPRRRNPPAAGSSRCMPTTAVPTRPARPHRDRTPCSKRSPPADTTRRPGSRCPPSRRAPPPAPGAPPAHNPAAKNPPIPPRFPHASPAIRSSTAHPYCFPPDFHLYGVVRHSICARPAG